MRHVCKGCIGNPEELWDHRHVSSYEHILSQEAQEDFLQPSLTVAGCRGACGIRGGSLAEPLL